MLDGGFIKRIQQALDTELEGDELIKYCLEMRLIQKKIIDNIEWMYKEYVK